MSLRSKHLKLVGVAGAAALTVGALASPALANGQATVNYTCTTALGDAHPSAAFDVASAPASMAVGQPLATTGTFTLDAATTGLATGGLHWVTFKGSITTAPSASQAGLKLSFPKTTLGNGAGGTTVADATGSTLAGSAVTDSFTFLLGDLGKVSLTGFDAGGTNLGTIVFPTSGSFGPCTNDATTTTLMDGGNPVTTKVVKDKTTTSASAAYSAKKKVATGTAKVKSKFGTAATGTVKFTLKKGTHTIKSLSGKLSKGVAKVSFTGVKSKGKYSITAAYGGSKTLTGSTDKASFTVK
jgi:hypothetical protein